MLSKIIIVFDLKDVLINFPMSTLIIFVTGCWWTYYIYESHWRVFSQLLRTPAISPYQLLFYYVVNSISFVINHILLSIFFLATLRPTKNTQILNTNQSYLELWLIIFLNAYVFYWSHNFLLMIIRMICSKI